MFLEAGVVVCSDRKVWHVPPSRTAVFLPDDKGLWDVIWTSFQSRTLEGFAHSHPGSGVPHPSLEDCTTFLAIEAALGSKPKWWICSATHLILVKVARLTSGTSLETGTSFEVTIDIVEETPDWLDQLRRLGVEHADNSHFST